MKARRVVKVEVVFYSRLQLLHRIVAFQVDILVLEALPQTLDTNIVQCSLFSVHADFDVVLFQHVDKTIRRKLAFLTRIEDRRAAICFDRFFQKVRVLQRVHRIEYPPAQNLP